MNVVFAVLLTALAFGFVAYPFFRRRPHSVDITGDKKLDELYSRRDTTYSMLKELEFDFQSGTLTDEDYRELEAGYKSKAISILKEIDNVEKGSGVEEEIDKWVAELRQGTGQFCPQCGAKCQESDKFCSHCGTSLDRGGDVD